MRNQPVPVDSLSEAQRHLYDAIVGPPKGKDARNLQVVSEQGTLLGPFNPMLHSPVIGQAVQALGSTLRFQSELPATVRELAILVVAQKWRSQFEWFAHEKSARRAGLDQTVIDSLRRGEKPPFQNDELRLAYGFVTGLIEAKRVSHELFEQAKRNWGLAGIVELTCLIGHYTTISAILNVFEVALPDGAPLPFDEPEPA